MKTRKLFKKIINKMRVMSKPIKITLIAVLVLVLSASGVIIYFNYKEKDVELSEYEKIYKNYSSSTGYSEAEELLRVGDGIKIVRYSIEGKAFVTEQTIDFEGTKITRYGLAGLDGAYVEPRYTGVLELRENYAIVVKPVIVLGKTEYRVGLIRFDENGVHEFEFNHTHHDQLMTVSFQGDYIAMFAGKDNINPTTATFTAFYDYKSADVLLEVFRVQAESTFRYHLVENHLIVIDLNKMHFLNTNIINSEGYLEIQDTFMPFPEDQYIPNYVSFSVHYLGNDWFLRKAIYYQNEPYQGFQYIIPGQTELDTRFIKHANDRFNARTKNSYQSSILFADSVANKYSDLAFSTLALQANLEEIVLSDYILYADPVVPSSRLTNSEYSVVYNYFFPETNIPAVSYIILDDRANLIRQENMFMPTLFIDGIGVENNSPNFMNLIGDAKYHTLDGEVVIYGEHKKNIYSYENTFAHNGMIVTYRYDTSSSDVISKVGAYDVNKKALGVPYIYDFLSHFFNGYAIGGIIDSSNKLTHYRVEKDGKSEEISNVYSVKHGVYITKVNHKYGLYANDGTQLIDSKCDDILLYQLFLTDNALITSIIITIEGDDSVIYLLK